MTTQAKANRARAPLLDSNDDDRELARQARVARAAKIARKSGGKVLTATEFWKRNGLPDSIEGIERGEQPGAKTQQPLFTSSD